MNPALTQSRKLAIVAPLLLLLAIGCAAPRPKFPIGLYNVPEHAFSEVRAAGFNIITGPAEKAFLDAAHHAGLGVLASSGWFALRTNNAVRHRIRTLDPHPALWAWYLFDEPDLKRIPPPEIELLNRALQRIARKPSFLVTMSGSAAAHYGSFCDLLAVDFYPVPWAPISQFGKEMKLARLVRAPDPYFAILQAFDWAAFPHLLDTTVPLRPPTRDELRCMVYLALAQGAGGIFFYSYEAGEWRLPDHPLWPIVKELVAEINQRLPLFTAEHIWWSPALEYLEGADAMHNEVRGARIMLTRLRVLHGNEATPPGDYVLAINTTAQPVPFRLELPTAQETVPLAGESIPVQLENGVVEKDFAPCEVVIYGPFQPIEQG